MGLANVRQATASKTKATSKEMVIKEKRILDFFIKLLLKENCSLQRMINFNQAQAFYTFHFPEPHQFCMRILV